MWHWERLRYISIYDYQGQRTEVIGTAEKIEAYKAMEERFLISMKQSGIIAWVYDIHNNSIVTEKSDHQLFIHAGEISRNDIRLFSVLNIYLGQRELLIC